MIDKDGGGEQRSRLLPAWMMVCSVMAMAMALALHAAATYEEVICNLLGALL